MHTIDKSRGFNLFLMVLWAIIFQTSLCFAARGDRISRIVSTGSALVTANCAKKTEWKCISTGKCISKTFQCDGRKDCEDGSDETSKECEEFECTGNEFQCKYGACVNKTAVCNGARDCADGSDESVCSSSGVQIKTGPSVIPLISGDGICDIPYSRDRNIVITDDESGSVINIIPGSKAPKFSKMKITCKPDYVLPNRTKVQVSVCLSKEKWHPPVEPCIRTCRPLHPVNVDLQCSLRGYLIDCESELITGTTVRPRCTALHRPEKEVDYRVRTLLCQENGQWDGELLKCVPDCGKQAPKPLISDGTPEIFGDSPWHVAIYKGQKNHQYICGGTLISPNLIVSAAHCFFDEVEGKALNKSSDYEIGVSKHRKGYNDDTDHFQKKHKVQEIIYTDAVFNPKVLKHYSDDIVVLVLKTPVEMSNYALPACIDWGASFQLSEDAIGKLVGWGDNKLLDTGSDILLTANLSYISYNRCVRLGNLNDLELNFLTNDKFCAGFNTGSKPRKGDSGGGFLFLNPNNGRYYLRGVVSTADSEYTVVAFTDIYKHLDWLERVYRRLESKPKTVETITSSKTTERRIST